MEIIVIKNKEQLNDLIKEVYFYNGENKAIKMNKLLKLKYNKMLMKSYLLKNIKIIFELWDILDKEILTIEDLIEANNKAFDLRPIKDYRI